MNQYRQSSFSWTKFLLQSRALYLALFIVFTLFFGYQLRNLEIARDVGVMFPRDHPNMVLNREFKKMLATPDKLICVVEVKHGDIYNKEALLKIKALTQAVLHLPGCDASDIKSITETSVKHMEATAWGVETNPVIFPSLPETPDGFEQLRRRVETDPGIRGVFVSYDGTAASIMAKWKKGDALGQLYKDLLSLSQTHGNENYGVHFAGAPALGANLIHLTGQLKFVLLGTLLAMTILLVVFLGNITGVLLSMTALILSAVWALGLGVTLSISISFLSMVWILFFCGASTAFAAFCFSRYHHEIKKDSEKEAALEASFGALFLPVTAGLVIFGFTAMALSVTDIPLLAQTGQLGSCWSLATFMTVMVFTPLVLSFLPLPPPRPLKLIPGTASTPRPVSAFVAATITAIVSGVIVAGIICANGLFVGDNEPGSAFFFPDNPYNQAFSLFNQKFIGAYNMTVVVEGREKGALNDHETMELMGAFQNHLENETDARSAISIVMMMKLLARLYHEGNPKWALIPTNKNERSTLGGAIKMGGSAGQWMDDTWTNGTIQAMYGNDSNALIKKRLASARDFIQNHPSNRVNFRLFAGFLGAISAMNDAGQKAYWNVFLVSLTVVFAAAFLVFRSILPAMAILVSLITGQSITWIFMALGNIGISIHIIPAGPFSLGIGGTLAILTMACYRETALPHPDSAASRQGSTIPVWSLAALGLIPVGVMLPWAFMDLKFMARAGELLAVSVFAQTAMALVLPVFLTNFFKGTLRITQKTNRGKR